MLTIMLNTKMPMNKHWKSIKKLGNLKSELPNLSNKELYTKKNVMNTNTNAMSIGLNLTESTGWLQKAEDLLIDSS